MKQKNNLRRAAVYGVAGLATAAIGASTANALVDDRPDDKPAQDVAQAAHPQAVQTPAPQVQKSAPQTKPAAPAQTGKVAPQTKSAAPAQVAPPAQVVPPQVVVKPVLPVQAPVVKQAALPQKTVKPVQTVKKLSQSLPVAKKSAAVAPRALKSVAPKLSSALPDKRFVVRAAVVDPPPVTSPRTIRKQLHEATKVVDTAHDAVEQAGKALEKARGDLKKAKSDLEKLRESVEKLKDHKEDKKDKKHKDHEDKDHDDDRPIKIMTGDRD